MAEASGGYPQQSRPPRCRHSVGRLYKRHRNIGVRQVEPDQPVPGRGRRRRVGSTCRIRGRRRWAGPDGGDARRRDYRRPGQYQAAGGGRSKADRPDAAVESGDLYRSLRSCPQAVCGHQAGPRQAVRCGPVLVQCCEGPLRDLPGGGVRVRGIALSAERLRALSDLQGRALQRQDAGNQDPGQVDCRRARDDGRRRV